MNQQAFAGVDPARLGEIRRRITLVKTYLRSPRSAGDREVAAGKLGITPGQFGRLVRAWQQSGSAQEIHGSGRSNGRPRVSNRLDTATRTVLEQAILESDPDVRAATLLEVVRQRCAAQGIKPPAPNTVTQHLKRAREAGLAAGLGERRIAVVQCGFRFPVHHDGAVARPLALLAVAIPEGAIIALETGNFALDEYVVARLVAQLQRLATADAIPCPIVAPPAIASLIQSRGDVRLVPSSTARTSVSRILGGRIGGLQIAFGARSDRDLQKIAKGRLNSAVSPEDADAIVRIAVGVHNGGRRPPEAFAVGQGADAAYSPPASRSRSNCRLGGGTPSPEPARLSTSPL